MYWSNPVAPPLHSTSLRSDGFAIEELRRAIPGPRWHRPLGVVIAGCILLLSVWGLIPSALGQTNVDPDILQTSNFHDLSPAAQIVRTILWSLAIGLVGIAAILTALRYRVTTNLYKAASDKQWSDDACEEAAVQVAESEIIEVCAGIEKPVPAVEGVEPAASESAPETHVRLYTPASGPAWSESMLNAFLAACCKANCLCGAWEESAARRQQSPTQRLDPREAELIRRFKARWHEFHVDPEAGIFMERAASAGKGRLCIISVGKEKRTIVEAGFNAGFVIESVGRYLKNTDLVYPSGLGNFHAPTKAELTALTPGEKDRMIRVSEIPDPWQAMIAGEDGPEKIYAFVEAVQDASLQVRFRGSHL